MWGFGKEATKQNDKKEGITNRPIWNFVRHLLEMVLAMVVGMMLLGGLVSLVKFALGQPQAFDRTSVRAIVMTVNMTIGMGLWMWHRGHSLPHIAEMAGAMFLPLAILIYPFWAGLIARGPLMGAMHMLMLPAMVGAMLLRRDIYTHQHRHRAPAVASRPGVEPAGSAMKADGGKDARPGARRPLVALQALRGAMLGLGKSPTQRNGKQEGVRDQGITARIARASARRPWLVIGLWAVLMVLGGMLAAGIGDVLTTDMSMSNETESARADRL
ncbi:MAG TPA: hypothetical protein VLS25_03580, partial [Dehalococcoidia bacterium]|nr:hypothetical protein [Dehalococcoidia bacterium]